MKNYFPDYETECNCGCGENNISKDFKSKLNKARELAGMPFPMSSVCRCRTHNIAEKGKSTSSHISDTEDEIECKAGDITTTSSRARFKMLEALIKVGFTRIGIAKTFIHVDDDKTKPPEVTWLY